MRNQEVDLAFQRLICERVMVCLTETASLETLQHFQSATRVHAWVDYMAHKLWVQMSIEMPGVLEEVIDIHEQFPLTWWDAVKERWFPAWALRRWPVRYRRIDVHQKRFAAVCPHVRIDQQGSHLQWLVQKQQDVLRHASYKQLDDTH
jgi:hypothetical protein